MLEKKYHQNYKQAPVVGVELELHPFCEGEGVKKIKAKRRSLFSLTGRVRFHTSPQCECIYNQPHYSKQEQILQPCHFSTLVGGGVCWSSRRKMKGAICTHLENVLYGLICAETLIIAPTNKYKWLHTINERYLLVLSTDLLIC